MPSFPPGFRFGAATAAYQIEGAAHEDGRGDSIWDTFCRVPGVIANGDTGDVACDHYHRWREDLDLMAALGLETYRFSISWPRVQPDGAGALNPAGVRFYREPRRGAARARDRAGGDALPLGPPAGRCRTRAAGPTATPRERFAEYAQHMARELGDLVRTWITHNEPWVATFPGHAQGRFAPGLRDWPTALAVSHHLLLSHGLAVPALPGERRDHPQPVAGVPGGARGGGGGAALRRPPQPLVPGPGAARRLPAGRARALRAPRRARSTPSATATSRSSPARSTSSGSTTTSPRACARTRATQPLGVALRRRARRR